jgi:hypothetical protein
MDLLLFRFGRWLPGRLRQACAAAESSGGGVIASV